MAEANPLTTTNMMAAASSVLEENGYLRVGSERVGQWPTLNVRIFENDYSIVAIVTYETWGDLTLNWTDGQAALVELISRHMSSQDAKAWEGYLVILTPSMPGPTAQVEANQIRYDTNRVRKLMATGDELTKLSDVERVLQPLLPLKIGDGLDFDESTLAMLPRLLSRRGVPEEATNSIIRAFQDQRPLLERLDEYRKEK